MGDGRESFVGIDLGAETTRLIRIEREGEGVSVQRRFFEPHGKRPGAGLRTHLEQFDWPSVHGAAVTGRLARLVRLPRVPVKQALLRACGFHFPARPVTLVSIGARGFSVLNWKPGGTPGWRENGRCAQGTGNFLGQLTGRMGLSVDEADRIANQVDDPIVLVRAVSGDPEDRPDAPGQRRAGSLSTAGRVVRRHRRQRPCFDASRRPPGCRPGGGSRALPPGAAHDRSDPRDAGHDASAHARRGGREPRGARGRAARLGGAMSPPLPRCAALPGRGSSVRASPAARRRAAARPSTSGQAEARVQGPARGPGDRRRVHRHQDRGARRWRERGDVGGLPPDGRRPDRRRSRRWYGR